MGWTALQLAWESNFLVALWLGASFRTCFDVALLVGYFSSGEYLRIHGQWFDTKIAYLRNSVAAICLLKQ